MHSSVPCVPLSNTPQRPFCCLCRPSLNQRVLLAPGTDPLTCSIHSHHFYLQPCYASKTSSIAAEHTSAPFLPLPHTCQRLIQYSVLPSRHRLGHSRCHYRFRMRRADGSHATPARCTRSWSIIHYSFTSRVRFRDIVQTHPPILLVSYTILEELFSFTIRSSSRFTVDTSSLGPKFVHNSDYQRRLHALPA
ncbi:hypothetical protein LZ31DRAFT_182097 [Colletotrichum somersetense]|nr:hypothetical protein LZ31DRAFT_182097 [Colletotrichum somersetense]